MSKKHISNKNQLRFAVALIILGVCAGILAIGLSLHNRHTEPKPPSQALTSRAAPSSIKPTIHSVVTYNVPPANPKYLTIPAIGVAQARVIKLGLASNSQIAVPDNIYDTGWYDGSAEPGQNGAMFIYGHVSSWTANGVFYNLKKLQPGDDVMITRGDNTVYTYQVVSSKVYPYNSVPMNTVLAPIDQTKPGLNLMTCTGQVIKGTSEFNERLVVFTSLVAS